MAAQRRRKPKEKIDRPPPEFPGVVLIDTREQRGYTFDSITADAAQGGGRLTVRTERATLPSGDYSLRDYAGLVAVERKSKADLYGTLGKGRDRFIRELERLNGFQFAAVVVEAEWSELTAEPPVHSALVPKLIYRSVLAFQQRFPRVHWLTVPGREWGERTTFRILQRFWSNNVEKRGNEPDTNEIEEVQPWDSVTSTMPESSTSPEAACPCSPAG